MKVFQFRIGYKYRFKAICSHELLMKGLRIATIALLLTLYESVIFGQAALPQPGGITSNSHTSLANWLNPEGSACTGCAVTSIIAVKGANGTPGGTTGTVDHQIPAMNFNGGITLAGTNKWWEFDRSTSGPNFQGDNLCIALVFKTPAPHAAAVGPDWRRRRNQKMRMPTAA